MTHNIRGSSVALNEVLDVTIDDICQVLSQRPLDAQMCRERLSGLMKSVVRMWQSAADARTNMSGLNNDSSAAAGGPVSTRLQLQPPPPRLVEAVPDLIKFLMYVSNIQDVDRTAEFMVWNLLFRLLVWVPTWPQRVANFVLSKLYFFLHSARKQLDRLSEAQERLGSPKWLYDVTANGGAPVESEVAIWTTALILFKLPTASVRVMLAPPLEQSSPQSAPFIKLLRKVAVDVSLFCVGRVRNDCMPSVSIELNTFPVPALEPPAAAGGGGGDGTNNRAFNRIALESMWLLGKTMRTAAVALHDGVGSLMPDTAVELPAGSNVSVSGASHTSRDSNAAAFLFDMDGVDGRGRGEDGDDDSVVAESPSMIHHSNMQHSRGSGAGAAAGHHGGGGGGPNASTEDGYRAGAAKEHGRSLCCDAAWLGGLRVLSSVVHTATFELLARRPDSAFAALTSDEIQELQAKPLFRTMGAEPGEMPDEDFGSTVAMLVRSIVKPKPYRGIVLSSVAQLSRCAISLCAIDGLSRHVRGRMPHPGITRAAFELLAAGIHHPKHNLLEHSLTQALAEVYMFHKGISQKYYVSVSDIGSIVSRVLDVTTEFEAALRTAYPNLFSVGHPYYEGWQQVVRVASWLSDTCIDDKPRRGEPLWQLSLYFLRHGHADQEGDEVSLRFGTLAPSADEYFAINSHREFLALRQSDVVGGGHNNHPDANSDDNIENYNETAFDFTSALRWCGTDEWEEQMDRIELVGSVSGSRATLNSYMRAQSGAIEQLASSAPSLSRRDAAFRARLHRLMTEQRTIQGLVKDGKTSFATAIGAYKPSPSMAASLCFFNEILEWCFAHEAPDVATEYAEAYIGVVDNLSGHSAVAASISAGLLQLHSLNERKRSALLTGLQAQNWCVFRLCDVVEGARMHTLTEGLFHAAISS